MTLEDVDGRKRDIPTKSGKWQVWLIGSRDSAKDSAAWGQAVEVGFKNQLDIVSIAEISESPSCCVHGFGVKWHANTGVLFSSTGKERYASVFRLKGPFPISSCGIPTEKGACRRTGRIAQKNGFT